MIASAMGHEPTLGQVGATKLWNLLIIRSMAYFSWPLPDDCAVGVFLLCSRFSS